MKILLSQNWKLAPRTQAQIHAAKVTAFETWFAKYDFDTEEIHSLQVNNKFDQIGTLCYLMKRI